MKRPLKIKKGKEEKKERKKGKRGEERKMEEGRKRNDKTKKQDKKKQKYSVRNRNEKNNPADVALFADIYHDIRRARPSGNMAQHHTRRRNNGLCTA